MARMRRRTWKNLWPWLALSMFLGSLPGCTTSVTVEGTVPTPLVAKIPATVAVYYSPEFMAFRHEEFIDQRGTFKVDIGEQNLSFYRNLMDAMFDRVVEIESPPPLAAEDMAGIHGVIVPEILKFGFLTPEISGLNFYSASIHYRVALYDTAGEPVGDWTLVGYGKAEAGPFGGEEALAEATLLAIRDGGARIAIDIPNEPAVISWIESRGSRQEGSD